ncbi:alpha/beta fold hydrolase [Candidatus Daviesbacteria bacterium]|nr:alpha/beta fold hydrolase [Candidatus Daviesbacteria bacterium]
MKNVLILHGTRSSSQDNWFPWLKNQLENRGLKVWVPDLPLPERPNLERYKQYIFEHWQFNKESIVIGHSSGAVAALGVLQYLPVELQIEKAILVAAFKDNLGRDDLSQLFVRPLNFAKIKSHVKKIILIHSENDPYVPFEHGQFLAEQLDGELVVMDGQKHFNTRTMGEVYLKFPQILEYI